MKNANGGNYCLEPSLSVSVWGLLHLLTITYISYEVSRKSSLYGAIGVALALLLWTYFAGRLLTASIAANASLWKRRNAGSGINH